MDKIRKQELKVLACRVRMGIIEGVHAAKSGHPGGSLSIADTLTYLYFEKMNVDPKDPDNEDRDRFVLSKGHTAPALYSTLAERGYFSTEELKSLRHIGAMLQGHPCITIPGVDMSSGSLGQGISAACGMALSSKLNARAGKHEYKVYTVLGDGEIEEGQVWEAAMFAAHYKLDNLVAIVDNNGLQIDGKIEDVMSPYPIVDKFKAFGWEVFEMNAHCFDSIEEAFAKADAVKGKPVAIIQKSVKGKGVSYMENNVSWHGAAPNDEQYEQAMSELNKQMACLADGCDDVKKGE
ncbi:MAG: transketolase [Ruminococcus sp.]|nr:transketolase [Ruminococcus sp.]